MKKLLLPAIMLCAAMIAFGSCSSDKNDTPSPAPIPTPKGYDVYVAGYEYIAGINIAKLWKNGESQYNYGPGGQDGLTDGTGDAKANSVYVAANGDVYVAGYEYIAGTNIAKLWKNGESQYNYGPGGQDGLTDGTGDARATSVYVAANGDVYVAGHENIGSNNVAKLWKNGVSQYNNGDGITDGTSSALTSALYVAANGDVYVAGYESDNAGKVFAKLWKNGESLYNNNGKGITDGTNFAMASSVYVATNGDVYATGFEFDGLTGVAKLWKNGVSQYNKGTGAVQGITDGINSAIASSVYVRNGDVYVAGIELPGMKNVAMVWKNGEPQYNNGITDGTNNAEASSVYVAANGDVYVAGFEFDGSVNVAKLWKNGVSQYDKGSGATKGITDGTNSAYATSVFVVPVY